ncbi:Histone-lysine N-methyltransferase [Arachis hypogaea]|nr:Histone-lysine N-methyltransferase [Arachis hypogaea]
MSKVASAIPNTEHVQRLLPKKEDLSNKRMLGQLLETLEVAGIEARMKSGYYIGRGSRSIKEDISRICRDAIKAKNWGDANDMNNMITLFIQLATLLEESSISVHDRDVLMT